jgi:8-oxo-dGTP diphosphatase
MELIYGTGNPAKLNAMRRMLEGLPVTIIGLREMHAALPEIKETGDTPLENAGIKARTYYKLLGRPVFSCDSGLYLWKQETGEPLPEQEQPGIHVRGSDGKRLTDEELLLHYTGLVRKYGFIRARYRNAICLVMDGEHSYESMEEDLWGEAFLLTEKAHERRVPGFPLDSISLDIQTGCYYYDLENHGEDDMAARQGFRKFFESVL